jgi:3-oxoacyl-[acyl-carrier protein] reductase
MSDRYLELSQSNLGKNLLTAFGLPTPPTLRRAAAEAWLEKPFEGRSVLLGAASKAQACRAVVEALNEAGATLRIVAEHPGLAPIKSAAADLKVKLAGNPLAGEGADKAFAMVFDGTGLERPEQLRELYDFFQPQVANLPSNARVVLIGRVPDGLSDIAAATAAAGLSGFTRSLAKEMGKKGSTCNLLEVGAGAEPWIAGALRFLMSPHAAYITGQSLRLGGSPKGLVLPETWAQPLAGKTALVTGAARGIGAAIAQVLVREGAQVIGLDHPSQEGALAETMAKLGGSGLAVDIAAKDAPTRIAAGLADRGLDVIVHNAGVTRDKMLRNMAPHLWDMVLEINLASILRVNDKLIGSAFKPGARMVCISSIGGIAGNAGQTNYGATKSGVMGYVAAMAGEMAKRGGAANAIAPGFIETQMTAQMPTGPREVGRRLSSLSQGGLPIDIAEAVGFMSTAYAGGVNGRTLRVCGQNFVGA